MSAATRLRKVGAPTSDNELQVLHNHGDIHDTRNLPAFEDILARGDLVARPTKKTKPRSPRLSAQTLERLANVVHHPRYGSEIVPSGRVGEGVVIPGPPAWSEDVTFPESAIPADVRKQNFSTMSHLHWYVDTLRGCRTCERPFLFFASEQQYWYETLRSA